jgi:hypothetical protein
MLASSYPVNCDAEKLTDYRLWEKPKNFGLETWGNHANMDAAKQEAYINLLKNEEGDFVIEGFTLGFPSERNLIANAIGPHKIILIYIDLNYEDWLNFYHKRYKSRSSSPQDVLARYKKCFESCDMGKIIIVSRPEDINRNLLIREFSDENHVEENKMLNILTEDEFFANAQSYLEKNPLDKNGNNVGYWKDARHRWVYYSRVGEIILNNSTKDARIIELGSMGMPVVKNSDLMDYDRHLSYYSEGKPDYILDARNIPWPIENNSYDWFVSLRVFHHLWPVQRECFEEAMRIARNVILVVPEQLGATAGTPILPDQFRAWNNGVRPDLIEQAGRFGYIYVWLEK